MNFQRRVTELLSNPHAVKRAKVLARRIKRLPPGKFVEVLKNVLKASVPDDCPEALLWKIQRKLATYMAQIPKSSARFLFFRHELEVWRFKMSMFRCPKCRRVREKKMGVFNIWAGNFPDIQRRRDLGIGGKHHDKLTCAEKVFMTLLIWRTYIDWGYLLRKVVVTKERDSQFIELYVMLRTILLFGLLFFVQQVQSKIIVGLVCWEIIGLVAIPLRIVFVDRYAKDWKPYSYHRSLIFVLWNYGEMVVAFAFLYLHLEVIEGIASGRNIERVGRALYYSVVTITTLGDGKMNFTSFGKCLASAEPVMGLLVLVVVVGLFFVEQGRQREIQEERRESRN